MSSASQPDHTIMSEGQLAELLSKVKSSRQTEELRARLPTRLAPFSSNIGLEKPIETIFTYPDDGVHCCSCSVKERKISMLVTVAPSADSVDSEPRAKRLELVWRDWRTSSRYLSGSADSHMHSISLQYGSPHNGTHMEAKAAFTGWYDDPGTFESECSHGGIKHIVEQLVQDMGFREQELDNILKLEVIEALLGDDGRQILESYAQEGTTLRKIIEDDLEEEDRVYS